jgi:hypothetical protein
MNWASISIIVAGDISNINYNSLVLSVETGKLRYYKRFVMLQLHLLRTVKCARSQEMILVTAYTPPQAPSLVRHNNR